MSSSFAPDATTETRGGLFVVAGRISALASAQPVVHRSPVHRFSPPASAAVLRSRVTRKGREPWKDRHVRV